MILVDATYINVGGGIGLLRRLLLKLRGRVDVTILRDIRTKNLDTMGFTVIDIPPSEYGRWRFYRQYGQQYARVLCFGNVPPLIKLNVPVSTYFHNVLFCEGYPGQSRGQRFIMKMKMAYIRFLQKNTDTFLVQSENMVTALRGQIGPGRPILKMPFFADQRFTGLNDINRDWHQFAYVSEAHPHKNHDRLLQAWGLLLARGLRPSLHLTVTAAYPATLAAIAELRQQGAKIINHGFTDPLIIYEKCGYQIYPSLNESFGLGLLEATDAGCAVLASDLPFVQSVIKPQAAFNPLDIADIAAVVERHLGVPQVASKVKITDCLAPLIAWCAQGEPIDPVLH